ncbi:MAG TPA: cell envelope integrity protein TolA [Nitrosomonas sp.]|nr:cell envelope integrity protein TolA [Nitrosomonas sp.]
MSINVLHFHSYSEPKKFLSGALALLMHIMFIAMMVFGLSWKNQPPEGMIVDLWSELPKPVQEPVASREPSKAIPPSEPLKPKPIEPPKPEVPIKPESSKQTTSPKEITPPIKKPDIELKQKPEPIKEIKPNLEDLKKKEIEERLKKIEAQKKEQEQKQELEKKQALEKQKEIEKQKELAAQKQKEQEAKARRDAEARHAAAQQVAARNQIAGEIAKYKAMILAKIRSRIVMPPDLPGNPVVEFKVTLLPGGDILDVKLSKSSGYSAFDSAVERAIFLSKPLPLPPDPALFNEFRNLNITVHYRE